MCTKQYVYFCFHAGLHLYYCIFSSVFVLIGVSSCCEGGEGEERLNDVFSEELVK